MHRSLPTRGLATARMAAAYRKGMRSPDAHVQQEARRMLVQRMGSLKGLPQKLGQNLSLHDNASAHEFEPLTEASEALPFEVVEQLLTERWGRPWTEILEHCEPQGMAASLGQVHRARLSNGTEVAIKLAYPGIREAVMADLKLLGWLGKAGEQWLAGFNADAYRQVILADLEEELNYRTEATRQIRYGQMAATDPVCVPRVLKNSAMTRFW